MRIVHVLGTRPNFVKMAPVIAAARERFGPDSSVIVHTGQHYDRAMSEIFFEELGVPEPEYMLGVGSGSHGEQTARVLERLEPVLRAERPDLVLVPGDVNSTLAAALCAARLEIPIGHVESGLRSFDRTMPEEINRIVTDHLSELLFLHSPEAEDNLRAEGVPRGALPVRRQHDDRHAGRARGPLSRPPGGARGRGRARARTCSSRCTGRRSSTGRCSPRRSRRSTRSPRGCRCSSRSIRGRGRCSARPGRGAVTLTDPVGYLDFLSLEADAAAVLTDSGGIQEETTYLGIPCFTLRDNTERPVTVRAGTNTLLGPGAGAGSPRFRGCSRGLRRRRPQPPEKWDGHAAQRVAEVLADW